ncbi:hypothetical protein WMF30_42790 [Sorangium sp. So ce134]
MLVVLVVLVVLVRMVVVRARVLIVRACSSCARAWSSCSRALALALVCVVVALALVCVVVALALVCVVVALALVCVVVALAPARARSCPRACSSCSRPLAPARVVVVRLVTSAPGGGSGRRERRALDRIDRDERRIPGGRDVVFLRGPRALTADDLMGIGPAARDRKNVRRNSNHPLDFLSSSGT